MVRVEDLPRPSTVLSSAVQEVIIKHVLFVLSGMSLHTTMYRKFTFLPSTILCLVLKIFLKYRGIKENEIKDDKKKKKAFALVY